MAICTCLYCLCLFKIVVVVCLVMDTVLISFYVFFGSMPPSFTTAIGFWLLLYANFVGMYLLLLSEATFKRNEDIWWINKLTQIGIPVCSFCFALGGILFVIPISQEAMMTFSKTYIRLYGDIPPFLDRMQQKFTCCGIYNYLDYGRPGFHSKDTKPGGYGSTGFDVYREANANDDFFHELVADLSLNRTVARKTTGLDVPQSCCKQEFTQNEEDKDCGKMIEYTGSNASMAVQFHKQELDAQRINDRDVGCWTRFHNINSEKTRYHFQLSYLLFLITTMSFIQCIFFMVVMWFHRMALKTIRQLHFWLPELEALHEQSEMVLHHAAIEAEADEAHDADEHSRKRSSLPNKGKKKKKREMVGDRSNLSIRPSLTSNVSMQPSLSGASNNMPSALK